MLTSPQPLAWHQFGPKITRDWMNTWCVQGPSKLFSIHDLLLIWGLGRGGSRGRVLQTSVSPLLLGNPEVFPGQTRRINPPRSSRSGAATPPELSEDVRAPQPEIYLSGLIYGKQNLNISPSLYRCSKVFTRDIHLKWPFVLYDLHFCAQFSTDISAIKSSFYWR